MFEFVVGFPIKYFGSTTNLMEEPLLLLLGLKPFSVCVFNPCPVLSFYSAT